MATLTLFAPGLYSANALGLAFLSGTVTAATFRGLPIVGIFWEGLDDPYIDDLVAFAAAFDAPLIVMNSDASPTPGDSTLTYLDYALLRVGPFFDSAKLLQPRRPTSPSTSAPVTFCGPFVVVNLTDIPDGRILAWQIAAGYSRTSQYHPYGLGMMAVSHFDGDDLGPPIYVIGPDTVPQSLDTLKKKWQGGAVTTTSQYQVVLDAAVARPGLAAHVNAALVPYVDLVPPV